MDRSKVPARRRDAALDSWPLHMSSISAIMRAAISSAVSFRAGAVVAAGAKKIPDTGKRIGLSHTWAIDVALQGGPLGFASGSTEMVTDSNFVGGNTGGYEPAFRRDAMEERVVADDGVIEIYANNHVEQATVRLRRSVLLIASAVRPKWARASSWSPMS